MRPFRIRALTAVLALALMILAAIPVSADPGDAGVPSRKVNVQLVFPGDGGVNGFPGDGGVDGFPGDGGVDGFPGDGGVE